VTKICGKPLEMERVNFARLGFKQLVIA